MGFNVDLTAGAMTGNIKCRRCVLLHVATNLIDIFC